MTAALSFSVPPRSIHSVVVRNPTLPPDPGSELIDK